MCSLHNPTWRNPLSSLSTVCCLHPVGSFRKIGPGRHPVPPITQHTGDTSQTHWHHHTMVVPKSLSAEQCSGRLSSSRMDMATFSETQSWLTPGLHCHYMRGNMQENLVQKRNLSHLLQCPRLVTQESLFTWSLGSSEQDLQPSLPGKRNPEMNKGFGVLATGETWPWFCHEKTQADELTFVWLIHKWWW
jgi:hypothetical protein